MTQGSSDQVLRWLFRGIARLSYAKPLVPSLMFFRRVANVSWRWAPDFVPDFVLVGLKPESDLTKYLNVHNVVELDALDDTQQ